MEKRLTLAVAAALFAGIGLLPVLAMVVTTFVADGGFSLEAYHAFFVSGQQPTL